MTLLKIEKEINISPKYYTISQHARGKMVNIVKSFSSVQFSHSDVSDSLGPHESQHTRPPYPSQTPRVY